MGACTVYLLQIELEYPAHDTAVVGDTRFIVGTAASRQEAESLRAGAECPYAHPANSV
jgi:hypothetical protein